MNETLQHLLIIAAVVAAVLYLVLRARKKKGCDSGCGCGKKEPLK